MSPRVSIVMTVWNGEPFLREAVESMLAQTFADFEFIVIDDGSTDSTQPTLEAYALQDSRVIVLRNEKNMGTAHSLNQGLVVACGEYIARMDADDIAVPERLEKQVQFLEQHPEVGIVGSYCMKMDPEGRPLGVYDLPEEDLRIRWACLLKNPFAHNTVMLRRALLTQYGLRYDKNFETAEDYDLWSRLLRYTRGANLSEPLVHYRLSAAGSPLRRKEEYEKHDRVAWRTIREHLPDFPVGLEEVSQLRAFALAGIELTPAFDPRRRYFVNLCWDLLKAFITSRIGEPGVKRLQHEEAARIAGLAVRRLEPLDTVQGKAPANL